MLLKSENITTLNRVIDMKRVVKFKLPKMLSAVILIIFSIVINTVSVSAAQLEILVKSPDTVNIGNSFEIVFSADRNTNIKVIRITVGYDSNYISFRAINKIQSGEINYNSQNNETDIIILFDDTLKSGDIFKLQLTAKTGNKSSEQKIKFEVLESVDKDLKDMSVKISGSIDIKIIKKDEQSSSKKNDSSNGNGTVSPKSSTANAKSSGSSKSSNTSSAKTSSKSNSSRVYSNVSKNEFSDNLSENIETFEETEEEFFENDKDNTTSVSHFRESENMGNLNLKNDSSKYVLAGVGGTLSVIGILLAAYRLGQLSNRKPESDKIFPKDDNADKW